MPNVGHRHWGKSPTLAEGSSTVILRFVKCEQTAVLAFRESIVEALSFWREGRAENCEISEGELPGECAG